MQSRPADTGILRARKPADVLRGMLPTASSAKSKWDGVVVESFTIPKLGPTGKFCYSNRHVVSVQREGFVKQHETKLPREFYPVTIAICPADAPQGSFTFSNARIVIATFDPAFVRRALGNAISADNVEIASRMPVHDEQLDYLVRAAEIEVESGLPSGRLYFESLGTALAAHLLTHYATKVVTPKQFGNTMPQHLLRRTIDFIRENLGDDMSLARLSADVGMSKYHFCHLFKASTGLSPHQYLNRERIRRARQLLAEHRLSLIEIANELGFSDQSHFTRSFHTMVGVTPSHYVA